MPEIIFEKLKSTPTGVEASTGKQTEVAFNSNFALVKTLLNQLFAIASITVTSNEITQIRVDTTTTPYTLYYTLDDSSSAEIEWHPLISVSFADILGSPMDNIALNTILQSKGSATDVATLQTQMTSAQSNISNLQNTVTDHTNTIGAHSAAINTLQNDVANRVRTPEGNILYLRYNEVNGTIEYSINGTNYIDILSSGISFAGITGDPADNANLVSYIAAQIANALTTISTIYATQAQLSQHTSNTNNPHNVTKAQLGLGNVDNTSDADKPISNAVQQALNGIINSMAVVSNFTPSDYRTATTEPGTIYFTSNSFVIEP